MIKAVCLPLVKPVNSTDVISSDITKSVNPTDETHDDIPKITVNSVDPYDTAHYEPCHLDLHCLSYCLCTFLSNTPSLNNRFVRIHSRTTEKIQFIFRQTQKDT